VGLKVQNRILILEDDLALLTLFNKVLTKEWFEVDSVETLVAANDLLKKKLFDVLVCDLSVIGGANAFVYLIPLLAMKPKMRVLLISGYIPDNIPAEAARNGVELIEKPFAPAELVNRVVVLLESRAA
jgi:two-component system, NtrC family, nitrogen regulation response regulator NtrX